MSRKHLTITLDEALLKLLDKKIDGHAIRNRSHAIETFLSEKLRGSLLKKAIILGGGEGVEIDGKTISKLMLPINGKTLIEKNIEVLKKYGITDIILSLGQYGGQVREKLGDGSGLGVKTLYFERDLGKAGVLRQAKSLLEETFLMMNGDILLEDIDLGDMYEFHKANKGKGTIMLATVNDPSLLGSVFMKGTLITRFVEKNLKEGMSSHLINAGVYFLEPSVCSMVLPDPQSLEHEIFPAIAKEQKLFGYIISNRWVHLHGKKEYEDYLNSINKSTS